MTHHCHTGRPPGLGQDWPAKSWVLALGHCASLSGWSHSSLKDTAFPDGGCEMLLCPPGVLKAIPEGVKIGKWRQEHFFKNKKNGKTPNMPKEPPSGVTHTCDSRSLRLERFWDQSITDLGQLADPSVLISPLTSSVPISAPRPGPPAANPYGSEPPFTAARCPP